MTARRVAAYRLSFPRMASVYGRPDADDQLQANVAAGVKVSTTFMTRYLQARTAFGFMRGRGWSVLRATDPAGVDLGQGGGASAFILAIRPGDRELTRSGI